MSSPPNQYPHSHPPLISSSRGVQRLLGGCPSIVGISGKAGAGKDTIAECLVKSYGYTRIGLADALKNEVVSKFPLTLRAILGEHMADADLGEVVGGRTKPLALRRLLQEYGTEVRRADNPMYWITRYIKALRACQTPVVTPDVRFPNEAEVIAMYGGVIIGVLRPEQSREAEGHASEAWAGSASWSRTFVNHGSIEDLHSQVHSWIRECQETQSRRL